MNENYNIEMALLVGFAIGLLFGGFIVFTSLSIPENQDIVNSIDYSVTIVNKIEYNISHTEFYQKGKSGHLFTVLADYGGVKLVYDKAYYITYKGVNGYEYIVNVDKATYDNLEVGKNYILNIKTFQDRERDPKFTFR